MSPTIFAIFVICSLDLLICKSMDKLTRGFEQDVGECQEYVEVVEEITNAKGIVMGKCIWTLDNGEDHE